MSQLSILEQAKAELTALGAFSADLPPIVDLVAKSIPINTIPDRMKLIISISEIISFASQFRRNIWHWDGFELPINATSFVIAGSGEGKDLTVKAVRRCFSVATANILEERKTLAKKIAISAASEAGETPPYEYENYKKFYSAPPPTLIAPTTPQGLIQHLNDIADLPLGAGALFAGELGDELATNANMLEIVKIIAEVFDTGDKESVYTKGKEFRSKEITTAKGEQVKVATKERRPRGASDDPRHPAVKPCERLSERAEWRRARAAFCLPPDPPVPSRLRRMALLIRPFAAFFQCGSYVKSRCRCNSKSGRIRFLFVSLETHCHILRELNHGWIAI